MKNRIQELRKEWRITQSELADAVDVTRQTIISLENGRYKASLVLAHKIAQYFGMGIEDVFIFDLEEENVCSHAVRGGEGVSGRVVYGDWMRNPGGRRRMVSADQKSPEG